MDDEPQLTHYEGLIIKAAKNCQSVTDIRNFVQIFGIIDEEEFTEIVLQCKKVE